MKPEKNRKYYRKYTNNFAANCMYDVMIIHILLFTQNNACSMESKLKKN